MLYADKLRKLRKEMSMEEVFEKLKPYLEESAKDSNSFRFYNENEDEELNKLYKEINRNRQAFKNLVHSEGLKIFFGDDFSDYKTIYLEW